MQEVPRVHPSNFFERDRHFFERGTMKDFEEFWRPSSFQLEHNRCPDVLQPSSSPRMGAKSMHRFSGTAGATSTPLAA